MHTDRIPGFAICAHCSDRGGLQPCRACGLLLCRDCRGDTECVVCYRERMQALKAAARKQQLGTLARRGAVIGCVALSCAAAAGAAAWPDGPSPSVSDPHLSIVARGEVSFIAGAVQAYSDAHGATCPPSLGDLRKGGYLLVAPIDPWGETLLYGCVESPRAFVVLSKGPDREVGTNDDLVFTSR